MRRFCSRRGKQRPVLERANLFELVRLLEMCALESLLTACSTSKDCLLQPLSE